jgi:hypothetical protein
LKLDSDGEVYVWKEYLTESDPPVDLLDNLDSAGVSEEPRAPTENEVNDRFIQKANHGEILHIRKALNFKPNGAE